MDASISPRLQALDFTDDMARLTKDFVGRDWIFREIDEWISHPGENFFLLTGEAGIGKSAIAARLTQVHANVAAHHFCIAGRNSTIVPGTVLRSIAAQLGHNLTHYGYALARTIKPIYVSINVKIHVETMNGGQITGVILNNLTVAEPKQELESLLTAPLLDMPAPEQPVLIVLDSLDEAFTYDSGENLVTLLGGLHNLPGWVRIVVTSRPEERVLSYLASVPKHVIAAESQLNRRDLRRYVRKRVRRRGLRALLAAAPEPISPQAFINQVAGAGDDQGLADGNFLYTRILLDDIQNGKQALDDLTALPKSLDEIYQRFMLRLAPEWETKYQPLLAILAVAREPLTREQLVQLGDQSARLIGGRMSATLVNLAVGVLGQFLDQHGVPGHEQFSLFHQSLRDYLGDTGRSGRFACPPGDGHSAIADYYLDHVAPNWHASDQYGLRYLPAHLIAAARHASISDRHQRAIRLHDLMKDQNFRQAVLNYAHAPHQVLLDLQSALEIALEDDDLSQAWSHIRGYYNTLQGESSIGKLQQDIRSGDYLGALERTQLYQAHPNPQAWARLWIAWQAVSAQNTTAARTTILQALRDLPTFNDLTNQPGLNEYDTDTLRNQLAGAAGRLLTRTIELVPPTSEKNRQWLDQTQHEVQVNASWLLKYWSESPVEWANDLPKPDKPFEEILDELEQEMVGLDHGAFRQLAMTHRARLAGAIAHSTVDPNWLDHVKRAVRLIALDDYPGYREMALAWLASGVLSKPETELAQAAMSEILAAALETRDPELPEDTMAMVVAFDDPSLSAAREASECADKVERRLIELAKIREAQHTIYDVVSAGRPDPWSWAVRRGSAIVAALYRSKHYKRLSDVSAILKFRTYQDPKQSFAGYRCHAYVSAAFRWLEPDLVEKDKQEQLQHARRMLDAASMSAGKMVDQVLAQERQHLVGEARIWIDGPWPDSANEADVTASLRQAEKMPALIRSYFLQFLSAIWANNALRLKQLLPYTLGDLTTTDAVFGRLVGASIAQGLLQSADLKQLVEVLIAPAELPPDTSG